MKTKDNYTNLNLLKKKDWLQLILIIQKLNSMIMKLACLLRLVRRERSCMSPSIKLIKSAGQNQFIT
jgi:hypothetical protein